MSSPVDIFEINWRHDLVGSGLRPEVRRCVEYHCKHKLMVIGTVMGLYSPKGNNQTATTEPPRRRERRKKTSFIQWNVYYNDTTHIISNRLMKD